jgi:hypothetical protein
MGHARRLKTSHDRSYMLYQEQTGFTHKKADARNVAVRPANPDNHGVKKMSAIPHILFSTSSGVQLGYGKFAHWQPFVDTGTIWQFPFHGRRSDS